MTPWELHSGGLGPPETPSWQAPVEIDVLILQVTWKCTGSRIVRTDQRLRLCSQRRGPGSIPGRGTRSHAPQLKIPHPAAKLGDPVCHSWDHLILTCYQMTVIRAEWPRNERQTDGQIEQRNQTEARAGHTCHGSKCTEAAQGRRGGLSEYTDTPRKESTWILISHHI